ncbi:MAG TPA: GNAT family N-acetyltransferase [Cellulomonas sp.]
MDQPTCPDVHVVPANEASWEDIQTVLGAADYAHLCQCQRHVWADRRWFGMPFEERAFHLREQTNAGDPDAPQTSGVVAYLQDEPVGWCEVGPRSGYLRVRNSPVAWKGRSEDKDDDTVWSAVCFVVRRGYRGRHLTYDLARGAADHARTGGARAVEGYPMATVPGSEVTWGELNVGPLSAFLAAGFHEVTRPTLRRVVVRLDL